MRIENLSTQMYEIPLIHGPIRKGALLCIIDEKGNSAWAEIAPLPKWSSETLEEALDQLQQKKPTILQIDWTNSSCLEKIKNLELFPSVSFALESAILSILIPLSSYSICTSALLMGTPHEILSQAQLRYDEGYTSAKLKVGNLTMEEAFKIISQLKDRFRLRIDVNRAWSTEESLHFFSAFALDTFDYVEEPFQNPKDLNRFLHPLAVDESFPHSLSLEELESLPTLKALIYKPTIQGGLAYGFYLHEWATKRGIDFILSSSFETDIGLAHVGSIAKRLSIEKPVGIGTYHCLKEWICANPLKYSQGIAQIPAEIRPKRELQN